MSDHEQLSAVQEVVEAVGLADTAVLLRAAVGYFDRYGDAHDSLSTSQREAIEQLRPVACQALITADDLQVIDPWDLLSILTTAVELYDIHGGGRDVRLGDDGEVHVSELAAAVERVRPFVDES